MNIIEFNNNNFGNIRTIVRDDEIWFIGKDVAKALGYENATKAVITHVDKEDIKKELLEAESQNGIVVKTEINLINESGLYSLILRSKLPQAKQFKRWVTSEVLPSIRKTGSYNINKMTQGEIAEDTIRMFKAYKEFAELCNIKGNQALLSANKVIKKDLGIDLLAKAEIQLISDHKSKLFTPTEIGKEINLSNRKVNKLLESLGYQEKISGQWIATELGKDYVELLDTGKKHSDGTPVKQMKWKYEIIEILKENK